MDCGTGRLRVRLLGRAPEGLSGSAAGANSAMFARIALDAKRQLSRSEMRAYLKEMGFAATNINSVLGNQRKLVADNDGTLTLEVDCDAADLFDAIEDGAYLIIRQHALRLEKGFCEGMKVADELMRKWVIRLVRSVQSKLRDDLLSENTVQALISICGACRAHHAIMSVETSELVEQLIETLEERLSTNSGLLRHMRQFRILVDDATMSRASERNVIGLLPVRDLARWIAREPRSAPPAARVAFVSGKLLSGRGLASRLAIGLSLADLYSLADRNLETETRPIPEDTPKARVVPSVVYCEVASDSGQLESLRQWFIVLSHDSLYALAKLIIICDDISPSVAAQARVFKCEYPSVTDLNAQAISLAGPSKVTFTQPVPALCLRILRAIHSAPGPLIALQSTLEAVERLELPVIRASLNEMWSESSVSAKLAFPLSALEGSDLVRTCCIAALIEIMFRLADQGDKEFESRIGQHNAVWNDLCTDLGVSLIEDVFLRQNHGDASLQLRRTFANRMRYALLYRDQYGEIPEFLDLIKSEVHKGQTERQLYYALAEYKRVFFKSVPPDDFVRQWALRYADALESDIERGGLRSAAYAEYFSNFLTNYNCHVIRTDSFSRQQLKLALQYVENRHIMDELSRQIGNNLEVAIFARHFIVRYFNKLAEYGWASVTDNQFGLTDDGRVINNDFLNLPSGSVPLLWGYLDLALQTFREQTNFKANILATGCELAIWTRNRERLNQGVLAVRSLIASTKDSAPVIESELVKRLTRVNLRNEGEPAFLITHQDLGQS